MKHLTRIYYTETDKALMWDRWQEAIRCNRSPSFSGRNHSSIAGILSRTGGIRPPKRVRSTTALSVAEREEISRGLVSGDSMRAIAATLGRAPSTVSREIKRNGGLVNYRATHADQSAWDRGKEVLITSVLH
jgi:DNA-binding CsgD family transcriptional regulator